ncbi:microprocessor complex subunit DGCR8-like [Anopheles stephensi]|uniref:microprocessor complex subunit DGCR8-like n=1 Tax=Anopheles stephensi TaxID=30069 RepID=UPI001658768F|nr:microprocessor complex subunit DGCR8-like [Anopheles stephensi]XP_035917848.1 microprocessor complex subunit DGCR8-like [Anopheles stephensi]XP_035917849.1 microprocessor complex subunit DGCR8-like [Anopheles stephensi]XP_035917850.1 microprocessor complex subunit DGCR8-like [Anopheles stephensi]
MDATGSAPSGSETDEPRGDGLNVPSGCPMAKRRKIDTNAASGQAIESDEDSTTEASAKETGPVNNLREFDVLDEVQGDNSDEDSDAGGGEIDDGSSEGSDVNYDDIESMLDEGLPEELRNTAKKQPYEERFKQVLEEKGRNHFEVLPEGWVQATHTSGMPLYLHKVSRVCTASRPYFLGPGSVRKHEIPLSAIPCLNYRKALEKEEELKKELAEASAASAENGTVNGEATNDAASEADATTKEGTEPAPERQLHNAQLSKMIAGATTTAEAQANAKLLPLKVSAKIETVTENLKAQSLTPDAVMDYCKKLFRFKTIRVLRFKSWAARRKFTKHRKHIKNLQRPTLPDGTKLITFPMLNIEDEQGNPHARPKKEWIMNPNGKSYVCILHEYVQHALRKQPTYEFKELENAATPYSATVTINDLKYGTGYGTSKKQAKSEAARETLEILIPDMKDKITGKDGKSAANGASGSQQQSSDLRELSVFDEIKIEDPRVAEFCAKTTEPSPHAILLTCLQRNFGLGEVHINYEVNTMKHRKNEFTMTVGKHVATVACKNKRDGKQRASQAILQILHPHIKTWGSLLRLYGNRSVKSYKEKKQEEQEITVLQSKAAINQPNYAILEKLKQEMSKLEERQRNVRVIGKFVPPSDIDLPTGAGANLKNVDL